MSLEDFQTPAPEQLNDVSSAWQQDAVREAYRKLAANSCSGSSAELPPITILPPGTAKGAGIPDFVIKGPGFNLPTRGCRVIKIPAAE